MEKHVYTTVAGLELRVGSYGWAKFDEPLVLVTDEAIAAVSVEINGDPGTPGDPDKGIEPVLPRKPNTALRIEDAPKPVAPKVAPAKAAPVKDKE